VAESHCSFSKIESQDEIVPGAQMVVKSVVMGDGLFLSPGSAAYRLCEFGQIV
jgi:hypothetical protein